MYLNFVLLSAAGIPGSIATAVCARKLGRKTTSLASAVLCGVACFAIAGLPDRGSYKVGRLVLGVLGRYDSIRLNLEFLYF